LAPNAEVEVKRVVLVYVLVSALGSVGAFAQSPVYGISKGAGLAEGLGLLFMPVNASLGGTPLNLNGYDVNLGLDFTAIGIDTGATSPAVVRPSSLVPAFNGFTAALYLTAGFLF
jgi:hypothetical protein